MSRLATGRDLISFAGEDSGFPAFAVLDRVFLFSGASQWDRTGPPAGEGRHSPADDSHPPKPLNPVHRSPGGLDAAHLLDEISGGFERRS